MNETFHKVLPNINTLKLPKLKTAIAAAASAASIGYGVDSAIHNEDVQTKAAEVMASAKSTYTSIENYLADPIKPEDRARMEKERQYNIMNGDPRSLKR